MVKRIAIGNKVKVIDKDSTCFGDSGVVIGEVFKPVGMRLRNHLQVRLDSKETVEIFLPEQLEVMS